MARPRRIPADPATLALLAALDGLLAAAAAAPLTVDTFATCRAYLDAHVEAVLASGGRDSRRAWVAITAREVLADLRTPDEAAGTGLRHYVNTYHRPA